MRGTRQFFSSAILPPWSAIPPDNPKRARRLRASRCSANAQTYLEQVYKILDRERTEVRYNSEWLGKL